MALRWQGVGVVAHALDADHRPGAFERFRALCGRWCEVWPRDVRRHSHRWKFWDGPGWLDIPPRYPCPDCEHTWTAMRELTRRKSAAQPSEQLVHDYSLFHLEADLRWLELAVSRLEHLTKEIAP